MKKFSSKILFGILFIELLCLQSFSLAYAQSDAADDLDLPPDSESQSADADANVQVDTPANGLSADEVSDMNQAKEVAQARDRQKDFSPEDGKKSITLRMLLEQGLRQNYDEKSRQYQDMLFSTKVDALKAKFWLPQLQMVMKLDNQKIKGPYSGDKNSSSSHAGTGEFGLQIGDYTVFNWGKDHLDYLNSLSSLQRQKDSLFEKRRDLKHHLISLYFQMVKAKNLERVYRDHVRHTTFIYRLNREKAPLKKISAQEYLQTRSLYLLGQKLYNEARLKTHNWEREISYSIGDPSFTFYFPEESLLYKKLNLDLEESLRQSRRENSNIKDSQMLYLNSLRTEEKTFKDNLPLPKFSLNFGSYTHSFSNNNGRTAFQTNELGPGGENIELRASINMTWDLIGEKGLLNSREKVTAHYQKMIAENEFNKSKAGTERTVRELYQTTTELEQQMLIAKPLLENAQKKFDQVLENYVQGRSSFLVLQDALNDLRLSEENHEETKYLHLVSKLDLAKAMGVEDLPGENFENLAVRGQ